ncbi:MAG: hypothetical protein KAH11_04205 [Rhodospirillales bacterium]|nr:hypothetical protein [Rhodospirillales bacterium]
MGNFDVYSVPETRKRPPRSVLRGSVGPNARNAPEDLQIITRTLAAAGLLDENAPPALAYQAIFTAIRHVRRTLKSTTDGDTIAPGDDTERAVRRAIATGRLVLSHRAVQQSTAPKGTRKIIDAGMKRALHRLSGPEGSRTDGAPERRALLPTIDPDTFRANRRLAEALMSGGKLPGLERIIAETIREGGKRGFTDVRDFVRVLERHAPATAQGLLDSVEENLKGMALRRFRKLRRGASPTEGDFDPPQAAPLS